MFSDLGEVAFYRRHPVCPSNMPPSCHQSHMLQGFPLCGLHVYFCCGRLATVGDPASLVGPGPFGCQVLPCMEAACHWLVGLGHKAAGCGIQGAPRAGAGSLVGGVGVQEILRLVPASWLVKPGLRADKARSWSLAAGPKGPRAGVERLLVGVSS